MFKGVSAVIAAGGHGARFGGLKQFEPICGASVIERSAAAFAGCASVFVTCPKESVSRARSLFMKSMEYKNIFVIEGGETRSHSSLNALNAIAARVGADSDHIVLIHDAARPLVTQSVIKAVIAALAESPAVIPIKPVTDTIARVHSGTAVETLNRDELAAVSTPQGFLFGVITEAYSRWLGDGAPAMTDDAAVVSRYMGIRAKTVIDDGLNIKITTRADLETARRLFPLTTRSTTPIEG